MEECDSQNLGTLERNVEGESGTCSEDGEVASCPGPGRTQPAARCQSPPGLKGPLPEDSAFDVVSNGGHLSAPG